MAKRHWLGLGWVCCLGCLVPFGQVVSAEKESAPAAGATGLGRVELVRDKWGIPHVFASTDAGAFYGLGWAAAEERAFQMYYSLRMIQGRLAELVGERPSVRRRETALDHDRKMRTFGSYRAAQIVAANLDPETLELLNAYSDGVNDYVQDEKRTLHPLFDRLGLKPEPWTPADCIASWWHLGQFFASDGTRELIQYRNLAQGRGRATRPGERGAGPLRPPAEPRPQWYDDEAAVVLRKDVPDDWIERVRAFAQEHGLASPTNTPVNSDGPKFSHAWVVGGKKTTTGAAVLVSDPQTPVRNPSLWHEFHVSGKTFNARGVGVPGSPGLLIGWNTGVAWGATALGADQADLFRLQTDPSRPDQYFYDGEWRQMQVIRETIQVKDGAPVELLVRQTHLGPVVTRFAFAAAGDPEVALKRVPLCQTNSETIQALIAMMRASELPGFVRAISAWQFPSINMLFGDRQGNIGYWALGAFPVRSQLDTRHGTATVDGTRSDYDWQGFVPHDLLPNVVNPGRGWLASANHRAIGSFYALSLGLSTGSAGHTVRSWRLYERLAHRDYFTPRDVLNIHFDAVNPARRDIVRLGLHLRDVLERELSPEASLALDQLKVWHARGARSELTEPGGALAGEINTFFRFVNTPLALEYGGGESGLSRFLHAVRERLSRDPQTELSRDEQEFVDQALAGAWESAKQRFGSDPARWNEQAQAQLRQRTLGWFESLDGFGSLDPAGDLNLPALTCVDGGTIKSQAAQSYTQFVPLHDIDAALSLLPPGHSEWVDNPARTSTMELWSSAGLHPAPLSRAAVEKIAASRVVLKK